MNRVLLATLLIALFLACAQDETPSGMVLIPGGKFTLGFDPAGDLPAVVVDRTAHLNAQPLQKFDLKPFYIDMFEVTYDEFLKFKPKAAYKTGKPEDPMRGVSWYEADAYCMWLDKRLPTEFEWEKAARGSTDDRLFVWGNGFKRKDANLGKKVMPAGSFPKDKSPYGIYDMTGNVSEWTASEYIPYPGSKFKDDNFNRGLKVIRGASYYKRDHGFMKEFAMVAHRNFAPGKILTWDTGFRCAKDV